MATHDRNTLLATLVDILNLKHSSIVLIDYQATCAAGAGLDALRSAIDNQNSGLRRNDIDSSLDTWIGKVDSLDHFDMAKIGANWQSRNNALIHIGLHQGSLLNRLSAVKDRFGAERIGIIMGSSTSSIDRSEAAYRHLQDDGNLAPEYCQEKVLNPHSPGLYVAHVTGILGPNVTINTACSSSAKVFAAATRWIELGIVDAVLVGGADTLCLSVLHGFNSLQLVSAQPCRPFDQDRDGINLGEGAGFAILAKQQPDVTHCGIRLCGYGESSDAHHMSHPHPEGKGARLAIDQALAMAELLPENIDYINLHGTASRANDRIEGNLIARLFDDKTHVSSTKGWMGHTLGAAGILEGILAIEAMVTGVVPGTLNLEHVDSEIPLDMSCANSRASLGYVMTNSFGFGGNNACLIFGQV